MPIPDRIRELRRVPARSLRPHPQNWRVHSARQREVLQGALAEIGYADALLARELPDGSLQLLDGHLRAETTPDQDVPVLVVDVNDEEARKLLLTLDPLAALAGSDPALLDELLPDVETDHAALRALWEEVAASSAAFDETLAQHAIEPHPDDEPDHAETFKDAAATATAYEKFPRLHRPEREPSRRAERVPELYQLLIECVDEAEQKALFEHLRACGHRVKVVNL